MNQAATNVIKVACLVLLFGTLLYWLVFGENTSKDFGLVEEAVKDSVEVGFSLRHYSVNSFFLSHDGCEIVENAKGLDASFYFVFGYSKIFSTINEAREESLRCLEEYALLSDQLKWCRNNDHLTYQDYSGCRDAEESRKSALRKISELKHEITDR